MVKDQSLNEWHRLILGCITCRNIAEQSRQSRERTKARELAYRQIVQLFQRQTEIPPQNNDPTNTVISKPNQKVSETDIIQQAGELSNNNLSLPNSKIDQLKKDKQSTCKICEENQLTLISLCQCEHKFCENCLRLYALYQISIFQPVHCPQKSCPKEIDSKGQIYMSLNQKDKQKYSRFLRYRQVNANPHLRLCPTPDCDGVIEVGPSEDKFQTVGCTVCQKVFCKKCMLIEHGDRKCEQGSLDLFQNEFKFRQCRKCRIVIQKNQGCNHITCKCGHQFCYLCGGRWNPSHQCGSSLECNCCCQGCCACLNVDCCEDFNPCRQLLGILLLIVWLLVFILWLFLSLLCISFSIVLSLTLIVITLLAMRCQKGILVFVSIVYAACQISLALKRKMPDGIAQMRESLNLRCRFG